MGATMDRDRLAGLPDQLASQGSELQDTEVKLAAQGLPSASVLESMSAFANRRGGGAIVFGVDESAGYSVVGVYDGARLQEEMAALASDAMEPPIRLDFTLLEHEAGAVVAAEVPECPDERKPCYIRDRGLANGAFRRVGNTNRRMTADELAQFLGSLRDDFEAEPVRQATLEDLDADAIERYRQAIIG
ncbi:MAG TPA: ATP-binding protein, partial [Thioalkalivibrio sp.]|nr:ATP-binding protein [Thioalkalivibrio sp.]